MTDKQTHEEREEGLCFRRCLLTHDPKRCADQSRLMIASCNCDCHDKLARYADAIRAESFQEREEAAQVIQRYVAAGDEAVTAMRGLEAQIASLKAELRNVGRTLRDLGWDGLKDRDVARGRHEKGL